MRSVLHLSGIDDYDLAAKPEQIKRACIAERPILSDDLLMPNLPCQGNTTGGHMVRRTRPLRAPLRLSCGTNGAFAISP